MKFKNTGKKERKKIMILNNIRNEILEISKHYVSKNGWNEELLDKISKNSKYDISIISTVFPEGYISILQLYLDEINLKMSHESKKLDLIRLKVHERVRELCIIRLNIMTKEKKIISKTLFHLLLPNNYKFCIKNLYKTVDQIWYLAGDSSTDFNFYSKRILLASIYLSTILYFINNDKLSDTIALLDKQLKQVAKIPRVRSKIKNTISLIPQFFKLRKKFNFSKQ